MFLHVKFHDNDFSFPLVDALKELWNYTNDNNGHKTKHHGLIEMFIALNERGILKALIVRLWVLKAMAIHVEWETRGLHYEEPHIKVPDWIGADKNSLPIVDKYTDYFNEMSLEFVKNSSDVNNNGEHGWLDLNTGYVFNT